MRNRFNGFPVGERTLKTVKTVLELGRLQIPRLKPGVNERMRI